MTYPIYLDFDYTSLRDSSERDFVLALVDCSLRNETALLAEVIEWFQLDWMMDPLYRSVSEAVLSLSRNQQPLSSSTLSRCILASVKSANETLETAHKLLAGAFGWYHLKYYGMQLYDEYRRRRLAEDSAEVASQLCDGAPVVEAMDNLSLLPSRYQDLAIDRVDAADGAIAELIADIEQVRSPHFFLNISSLDQMTGGFRNGSLIMVAAETGGGKTVLLSQATMVRVQRDQKSVLYFSAEMTLKELCERWAAFLSQVSLKNDRRAYLGGVSQIHRLVKSRATPCIQVFEGMRHVDQLVASARAFAANQTLGLICVDYVQLFQGGSSRDTRERQVADVTSKLKMLAMECRVPVFAASQFNRSTDGGLRTVNSLRDSGSVANDSDVVMFLDSDRKCRDMLMPLRVDVVKNRHGRTGSAECQWHKPVFTIGGADPQRHEEFDDYK